MDGEIHLDLFNEYFFLHGSDFCNFEIHLVSEQLVLSDKVIFLVIITRYCEVV